MLNLGHLAVAAADAQKPPHDRRVLRTGSASAHEGVRIRTGNPESRGILVHVNCMSDVYVYACITGVREREVLHNQLNRLSSVGFAPPTYQLTCADASNMSLAVCVDCTMFNSSSRSHYWYCHRDTRYSMTIDQDISYVIDGIHIHVRHV